MYRYEPVEEWIDLPECGEFISYGIRILLDGQVWGIRSDVFTERAVVEEICRLCTAEQVEPVHLEDVIDSLL